MCCSRPSVLIVSLKITASALFTFSMWKLKSPSVILLWYWGSLLTNSSVMSLMNIPFVVLCSPFGGGWYIPIMCIGLFLMVYLHIAYTNVGVLPFLRSLILLFLPKINAVPTPLFPLVCCWPWQSSDWLSRARSSCVSLFQGSVISAASMSLLVSSWTTIGFLFFTDLAFNVDILMLGIRSLLLKVYCSDVL